MGTISRQINQNLTLAERLKRKKLVHDSALLLDTSGSMSDYCDGLTTKIEALMNILKSINCKYLYSFNSYAARLVDRNQKLYAGGGTNLYPALLLMKEDAVKSGIIITDGEIGDQDLTLKFIDENPDVKLQIIYVGSIDSKPAFLDILAQKTGGLCSVEDLASPKELEAKIQLLLNPGKEEEQEKNIQL